jgi:methionine salvage enolase-phosphatase E1
MACERNGLKPAEVLFLDDIGLNLKAARQLGMDTIRTHRRQIETLTIVLIQAASFQMFRSKDP